MRFEEIFQANKTQFILSEWFTSEKPTRSGIYRVVDDDHICRSDYTGGQARFAYYDRLCNLWSKSRATTTETFYFPLPNEKTPNYRYWQGLTYNGYMIVEACVRADKRAEAEWPYCGPKKSSINNALDPVPGALIAEAKPPKSSAGPDHKSVTFKFIGDLEVRGQIVPCYTKE